MCQAYEGERRFMVAMDGYVATKGWAAHRDGLPREYDNPLHDEAFFHGYDCRAHYKKHGDPVPWDITETHRKRTGIYDAEPTREEADVIA